MKIKPPRLNQGEEIGVIAPAGPVTQEDIEPGISLLESLGFEVVLSSHLYERDRYLAGSDGKRLHDLHSMFQNRKVRAIFCARGGYGSMRLLEAVDYELVRKNPKIIVGYSDVTALLLAVYNKTGLVTFHGPAVKDLDAKNREDIDFLLSLLSSEIGKSVSLAQGEVIRPGKAEGVVVGGNLSLICNLIATPFMPSLKGAIVFIEEKDEPLYRLDRMMTYLKLSGVLDGCVGVVGGEFLGCGENSSLLRLMDEKLSYLNVPIFCGLPSGHGPRNMPIPIGVRGMLDTENKVFSIVESCVSS